MEIIYSRTLECKVRRIQKRTAKKLFEKGREIFMLASKIAFDNPWITPYPAEKERSHTSDFERLCDSFLVYNCDAERGRYIHFFVKI